MVTYLPIPLHSQLKNGAFFKGKKKHNETIILKDIIKAYNLVLL